MIRLQMPIGTRALMPAIVMVSLLTHVSSTMELVLASGRQARAVVVLSKDASDRERTAGEDLRHYLSAMSGAQFVILTDDDPAVAGAPLRIHVGQTVPGRAVAAAAGLKGNVGGYVIHTSSADIVITGADEYGSSNGVYGFLEDHLGVHWPMPGELFEILPNRPELHIGEINEKREPDFVYRGFSGLGPGEGQVWARRNRLVNGHVYAFHHNVGNILPVSKYGDHPEYYSLVNGKRTVPRDDNDWWWQPCTSNPDVITITAQAARDYFDAHPDRDAFSVGQNDTPEFCECPNCAGLDIPGRVHRGQPVYSDRYFTFVNEVARQIAETHPGKLIGSLAYWQTELPPERIEQMEPNVVIFLTQDDAQHFDRALKTEDDNILAAWTSKTSHLGVYTYYGLAYNAPRYYPHLAAQYLRSAHRLGADGFYCEAYPIWAYHGPQLYLTSRLLWDVDADPDAILDGFFASLYGDSATPMKVFYETLEEAWTNQQEGAFFGVQGDVEAQVNIFAGHVKKLRTHLAAAKDRARTLAVRARIEYVEQGMEYFFALADAFNEIHRVENLPVASREQTFAAKSAAGQLRALSALEAVKDAHQRIPDRPATFAHIDGVLGTLETRMTSAADRKNAEAEEYLTACDSMPSPDIGGQ